MTYLEIMGFIPLKGFTNVNRHFKSQFMKLTRIILNVIEKEMWENIDSIRSFWYCFDSLDA